MQKPTKIDVFLYSSKSNFFTSSDQTKLRRYYKNGLELNNIKFISSPIDDNIKLVHFTKLNDYKKFNSFKNKKYLKIANVFFTEKDKGKRIVQKTINKDSNKIEYKISRKDVDVLNEFDTLIVPTNLCKKFLLMEGVTCNIETLLPPLKLTKVNLEQSEISDVAYIYFHLEDTANFFVILLDYEDAIAAKKVKELAEKNKDYKFIVILSDINSKEARSVKKTFKRYSGNIILASSVPEDVYYSAMYHSKGVILLNDTPLYILEIMEALAMKKPLLALKTSVIPDMIIDKINGHVYNEFALLIQGVNDLIKGTLLDVSNQAYKFALESRIQITGEKLVEIYLKTLKEKSQ